MDDPKNIGRGSGGRRKADKPEEQQGNHIVDQDTGAARLTNADFLAAIFGEDPPGRIAVAHFPGRKTQENFARAQVQFIQPPDCGDWPHENTFFCPAFLDGGRNAENFIALPLIVFDDVDPGELLEKLPPTYIVRTSEGKYQSGWLLKDPVTDYDAAHDLLTCLQSGAWTKDASGNCIPIRWARLPVGTHGDHGTRQKLIHWDRVAYTQSELLAALGGTPTAIVTGKGWNTIQQEKKQYPLEGKLIVDGRKEFLRRLAMSLANQGKTRDEVEAQLETTAMNHFKDPVEWLAANDDVIRHCARTAVKKVERQYRAKEASAPEAEDDWSTPRDFWNTEQSLPTLPSGLLPAVLEDYANSSPQTLEPNAFAFSLLTACSMAASDNVVLQVTPGWQERACVWNALWAPPSGGKSPILRNAIAPLRQIQNRHYAAFKEKEQIAREAKKKDPTVNLPEFEPLFIEDTTVAGLSDVLKLDGMTHGVGLFNEEISGMFAMLTDASNKKGETERGPVLKLFDGGNQIIQRVQRGRVYVPNWSASILGGITDSKAMSSAYAKSDPDGFMSRLGFIRVPELPLTETLGTQAIPQAEAYEDLIDNLITTRPAQQVIVRLAPAAEKLGAKLRVRWQQRARDVRQEQPFLSDRLGKYVGLLFRYAVLLMQLDAVKSPGKLHGGKTPEWHDVTVDHIERANAILEVQAAHDAHFYETLSFAGRPPSHETAVHVARSIIRTGLKSFLTSDLVRSNKRFEKAPTLERVGALSALIDAGWISPDRENWRTPEGIARGMNWDVNPQAHRLYGHLSEKFGAELVATRKLIEIGASQRREQKAHAEEAEE